MTYLDHHAATPLCPAARQAIEQALGGPAWANPSSVHRQGRAARSMLEAAREQIAGALGAAPADVVLTSGGTEACNLALGVLDDPTSKHVLTSEIEHPALAARLAALQAQGVCVTRLAVPRGVPPSARTVSEMIQHDTGLCALSWVNHETGTVLPIAQYAEVCAAASVPLLVDATQALGKLPIDLARLPVDLLAIASHKIGGPAGAGALFVRRGVSLRPLLHGGAQERGRRPGSPDLLAAVGFGAACSAIDERLAAQSHLGSLQRLLERGLLAQGAVINGIDGPRVGTVSNASFPDRDGPELVAALDLEGLCVSSGAACSSGLSEPSPVLAAMYPDDPRRARSAVRFSFGPETTEIDVENAQHAVAAVLARG